MPSQANLKSLKKEWYKKLEESGFKDIEDTSHPDSPLTTWHSLKWKHIDNEKMEAAREYYSKAKELLECDVFESETHKRIWELHSDGFSKRKIEKALENTENPLKRERIGTIILNLASLIK